METEHEIMFSQGFERERSQTPPLFGYHTYPAPEDITYPPYYRQDDRTESFADYMTPVPVTLPSMMHFSDSIKRDVDTMAPFHFNYAALPAIDLHGSHSYDDPNPHVSQLRAA